MDELEILGGEKWDCQEIEVDLGVDAPFDAIADLGVNFGDFNCLNQLHIRNYHSDSLTLKTNHQIFKFTGDIKLLSGPALDVKIETGKLLLADLNVEHADFSANSTHAYVKNLKMGLINGNPGNMHDLKLSSSTINFYGDNYINGDIFNDISIFSRFNHDSITKSHNINIEYISEEGDHYGVASFYGAFDVNQISVINLKNIDTASDDCKINSLIFDAKQVFLRLNFASLVQNIDINSSDCLFKSKNVTFRDFTFQSMEGKDSTELAGLNLWLSIDNLKGDFFNVDAKSAQFSNKNSIIKNAKFSITKQLSFSGFNKITAGVFDVDLKSDAFLMVSQGDLDNILDVGELKIQQSGNKEIKFAPKIAQIGKFDVKSNSSIRFYNDFFSYVFELIQCHN